MRLPGIALSRPDRGPGFALLFSRHSLIGISILAVLALASCRPVDTATPGAVQPTTTLSSPNSSTSPQPTQKTQGEASPQVVSPGEVRVTVQALKQYPLVKIAAGRYQLSVNLPQIAYRVTSENGYDFVQVNGAQPNQTPGAPVLPYLELARLLIPPGGRVVSATLTGARTQPIGKWDVPTVSVEPFSEGGITYTDMPQVDQTLPSDPLSFQSLSQNEWLFLFSPFSYNPQTREVWQHLADAAQIEFTAAEPLALGSLEITPSTIQSASGGSVHLQLPLWNLGTGPVSAKITLALIGASEETISQASSPASIEVTPASENLLLVDWQPEWKPGAWNLVLSLTGSKGESLGTASTDVTVR
jgi:hypothetical protein